MSKNVKKMIIKTMNCWKVNREVYRYKIDNMPIFENIGIETLNEKSNPPAMLGRIE